MKKHFLFLTCFALSVSMAQSQTTSAGTASGQAGAQTGAQTTAGQQQQTGAATQINPQTGAPNVRLGPTGGVLNEPAGANQAAGVNPGNTNRVLFGGTNQIQFGATNTGRLVNEPSGANQPGQIQFGTTNPVPFGQPNVGTGAGAGAAAGTALPTNNTPFAGSGTIQEPAGAANPNPNAGTAIPNAAAADAAFAQQLNTALSRGGATRIFFPQTRSTVTLVNQNGSILLTGMVSSDQERREIEAKVRNASGVNSVNNQLRVGTEPAPLTNPAQTPAPGTPRTVNPPLPTP